MPLIQVKLIENVLTPEQKSQIIAKLTDAVVSIEGDNMCPVTSVVIEELCSEGGSNRDSVQHTSGPLDQEDIEKMQEALRNRIPDGWA